MIKKPFACWLILVIVSLFVLLNQSQSMRVNSDIRAMLPGSLADPLGLAAREQLASKLEGLNFIAVGHSSKTQAIEASLKLAEYLEQTKAFDKVMLQRLDQGQDIARGLFPYRFVRLNQQQQDTLEKANYSAIIATAISQLWSPASVVSSSNLIEDPLFLFTQQLDGFAGLAQSSVDERGFLSAHSNNTYWMLLELRVSANVFSPAQQQQLIQAINTSQHLLASEQDSLAFLKAGLLFHADAATKQAKHEMSTIGVASILLISLLILFFFRSVKPLVLAIASLLSGLLFALAAVSVFFEQLHLLTLVFGASLIGIAIDYAFHFCAEHAGSRASAAETLRKIAPALSLSALSSVVAYLSMLFVPMQGVKQMAVFCASGLFGAAVSLYLLAPILAATIPQARWSERWLKLRLNKWSLALLGLFVLGGLVQLNTEDDIRQLRGDFPTIDYQQQQLLDLFQNGQANQFYLVRGDSPEQILTRERVLLGELNNAVKQNWLGSAWGLSHIIPTIEQQKANHILVGQLYQNLASVFEDIGFDQELAEPAYNKFLASKGRLLTPDSFLAAPENQVFSDFWVTSQQHQASVVSLLNIHNLEALQQIAQQFEGVQFVDPVAEISTALSTLRSQASALLVGVLVIIGIILTARLGFVMALRCLSTPVLAVLVALSVVGWLGQGLSLFHVLALLLVFGVGLDYALFYQLSVKPSYRLLMATTLAATSTILAFGLLALSATPALAGFGVIVLSGIACSYLLAPQFVVNKLREGE
ncbi:MULTISPECIES: MMPL family transporter [unclassified Agarivorans]|uniref:MMPL family transporter n=1 Tax=unclassified Agarivorans TaxID=2636026 RepID=UPI0026E2C08A|nr:MULTISPECIES: MMPL family transporter [unclassified Agarivorans]MDO6685289.1 MMPL family transporter [Agarivorans sp. 3_MG-2023]MDO6715539.1 MMPL family transporter [Agarivorans sp. 2_MG-2023]